MGPTPSHDHQWVKGRAVYNDTPATRYQMMKCLRCGAEVRRISFKGYSDRRTIHSGGVFGFEEDETGLWRYLK